MASSSSGGGTALVWFRAQDLRVHDNPALYAAASRHRRVVPVFVWAPHEERELMGEWALQGVRDDAAALQWLRVSVERLASSLEASFGMKLVVRVDGRHGASCGALLKELLAETGATALYFNRRFEPPYPPAEAAMTDALVAAFPGLEVDSFNAHLLYEPGVVKGAPHQVGRYHFGTLMWFLLSAQKSAGPPPKPVPTPDPSRLRSLAHPSPPPSRFTDYPPMDPASPLPPWFAPMMAAWTIGEAGALAEFRVFLEEGGLRGFDKARASRLSPYFRFGELSARTVYWTCRSQPGCSQVYLRRFGWRDLAYFQLSVFGMPSTVDPIRGHYRSIPWADDPEALRAWQHGRTGFPLVDAVMRELWTTGWAQTSHRQAAASLLVEYLGIHWREGERWFHDVLVDADPSIQAMMWQNGGLSGIDQWPRPTSPTAGHQDRDYAGRFIGWADGQALVRASAAASGLRGLHFPWRGYAGRGSYARGSSYGGGRTPRPIPPAPAAQLSSASSSSAAGGGGRPKPQQRTLTGGVLPAPGSSSSSSSSSSSYIAKWLPELARLPPKYRVQPWTAPRAVLADAGVTLGDTYPHRLPRLVNLAAAHGTFIGWMRALRLEVKQRQPGTVDGLGYDTIVIPASSGAVRAARHPEDAAAASSFSSSSSVQTQLPFGVLGPGGGSRSPAHLQLSGMAGAGPSSSGSSSSSSSVLAGGIRVRVYTRPELREHVRPGSLAEVRVFRAQRDKERGIRRRPDGSAAPADAPLDEDDDDDEEEEDGLGDLGLALDAAPAAAASAVAAAARSLPKVRKAVAAAGASAVGRHVHRDILSLLSHGAPLPHDAAAAAAVLSAAPHARVVVTASAEAALGSIRSYTQRAASLAASAASLAGSASSPLSSSSSSLAAATARPASASASASWQPTSPSRASGPSSSNSSSSSSSSSLKRERAQAPPPAPAPARHAGGSAGVATGRTPQPASVVVDLTDDDTEQHDVPMAPPLSGRGAVRGSGSAAKPSGSSPRPGLPCGPAAPAPSASRGSGFWDDDDGDDGGASIEHLSDHATSETRSAGTARVGASDASSDGSDAGDVTIVSTTTTTTTSSSHRTHTPSVPGARAHTTHGSSSGRGGQITAVAGGSSTSTKKTAAGAYGGAASGGGDRTQRGGRRGPGSRSMLVRWLAGGPGAVDLEPRADSELSR